MKNKGTDMDDKNFKALTAWRAVYEQRACPPDEVLFAAKRSGEMEAHLGYCRYCNGRLEMTTEDHCAWQELASRLKPLIAGNGQSPSPAPGQIWSLDRERLGGWGPYDRYYNPPLVLVLQLQDNGRTVRVAQVCAEEDLKGDDGADVWLEEGIGFAESWNVYSVHQDDLKVCRGEVERSLAKQVLEQSRKLSLLKEVDVHVQRFRELEVQVGAFVAMRAMPQVMAVVELEESLAVAANESMLERFFGSLSAAYSKLKNINTPDFADSLMDLLTGARDPMGPLPVAAATSAQLPVNIVAKQLDGTISIKTIGAVVTDDDWQDDIYFVAGRLDEAPQEELYLLASLNHKGQVISECQNKISKGSPYFDIVFRGIPKEASRIENLKFLLVRS